MGNLREELTIILKNLSGVTPQVSENLFDTGVLDSLALIHLVDEIEKKYAVQIGPEQMNTQSFSTLIKIEATIQELRSK